MFGEEHFAVIVCKSQNRDFVIDIRDEVSVVPENCPYRMEQVISQQKGFRK
jgi:hypothetical protein